MTKGLIASLDISEKGTFLTILGMDLKHLSDPDTKTEHYMNDFGNEYRFHRIMTTTNNRGKKSYYKKSFMNIPSKTVSKFKHIAIQNK